MKQKISAFLNGVSILLIFVLVALGADRACELLGIEGVVVQIIVIGFMLYMTSKNDERRKDSNVALLQELFSGYDVFNDEQHYTVSHHIADDFKRRQK